MKLVKCKASCRFLIKDEWYEVTNVSTIPHDFWHTSKKVSYELVNHTHKRWNTSWYHETNFYTLEELRDMRLDEILQKENFL
jgi:hypothetical protein